MMMTRKEKEAIQMISEQSYVNKVLKLHQLLKRKMKLGPVLGQPRLRELARKKMLNKKEFEAKNKDKDLYTIYFSTNSYAQMKSGEDIHFMSCNKNSKDNFIHNWREYPHFDKWGMNRLLKAR
ncbi:hypothetical protein [Fructilactobacillus sanfranciscensis]|uniref:hypothetical protein n=1 Tax=Fructilactobacillus sanfranciscensis TaxID=1625 RepID=UPI000CD3C161|nr:hypothetical protein [Fructilactobacillus sanfranciscensis]POH17982.1 hypothetical protein BGL45_06845 [Fructilactobacillus sanfranciscensis]